MPTDLGDRPTDEEMTSIVADLREAGLLTIGTDADGHETWTLTDQGPGGPAARHGDEATINVILDAVGGGTEGSDTPRP